MTSTSILVVHSAKLRPSTRSAGPLRPTPVPKTPHCSTAAAGTLPPLSRRLVGKNNISLEGLPLNGLHKSGPEIPLEISLGEQVREGKHIFPGILRDVSERSPIERELGHSQEKYKKMIHSSPDAITLRSLPDR